MAIKTNYNWVPWRPSFISQSLQLYHMEIKHGQLDEAMKTAQSVQSDDAVHIWQHG